MQNRANNTVPVQCAVCDRRGLWDVKRRMVVHTWHPVSGAPLVFCKLHDDPDELLRARRFEGMHE